MLHLPLTPPHHHPLQLSPITITNNTQTVVLSFMPSLVQKLFGFLTNDPLEDKKQQAQSPSSSTSKSPNSYDKLQQQQQLHQPPQSQYHGPGAYIWPPTNQNYVGSFSEQQQLQQLQLQQQQQQFIQAGYGPQPPAQLPPHRPPQQPSHISNSVHRTSQVNSRDASPSLRLTQHDTPPPLPSPDHPSLPPMPWLVHDVKSGAGSHVSTPSPTLAEKEGTMVEYESPGRKQRRSALDSVSQLTTTTTTTTTTTIIVCLIHKRCTYIIIMVIIMIIISLI
jgi:hypothetical protein